MSPRKIRNEPAAFKKVINWRFRRKRNLLACICRNTIAGRQNKPPWASEDNNCFPTPSAILRRTPNPEKKRRLEFKRELIQMLILLPPAPIKPGRLKNRLTRLLKDYHKPARATFRNFRSIAHSRPGKELVAAIVNQLAEEEK